LYWSKHTRYKYNGNILLIENNYSKCFIVKRRSFAPKMRKNTLAAGLCPDPLGSLSAAPDPLAAMMGVLQREGMESSFRLNFEQGARQLSNAGTAQRQSFTAV